jgi:tetratricopeptide (TPR) repeat protein
LRAGGLGRGPAAFALLLCLATLALHGRSIGFEFVAFDDRTYVADNPHVRAGLSLAGLRWALTATEAANWHPLTWLSHMLDVSLYGLDPGRHHLTSVLLHACNVWLLFALLAHATGRGWPSAFVAGLFAFHPLHVESVAWVAERKDLLSAAFGLLALRAYVAYARRPTARRYALTAACLALGLLAKPMLVTLPAVFLLLDVWPLARRRGPIALVAEKFPLLALSALSGAITLVAQHGGGAVKSTEAIPMSGRLANAAVSCVRYLVKTVWPSELALAYPHPYLPGGVPWSAGQVAGAALLLAAPTVVAALQWRLRPWLGVGWLWYLGMLAPVIGIVQVGSQAMADRYTYLPLVGPFVIVAWGAAELATGVARRRALGLLGIAVLVLLAALSWRQLGHWRDSLALFQRAVDVAPNNALMHNNLGTVLEQRGRIEEAARHYRQAIELRPAYPEAHNNLAAVLLGRGDAAGALEHYRLALAARPDYAQALNGLGSALAARGRTDEAITQLGRALALQPDLVEAHYNLANALGTSGRVDEAIAAYARALELRPDHAESHNNLGNALLATGRTREAIEHLARAAALRPDLAATQHNLGVALVRGGRVDEALPRFDAAIAAAADWPAPLKAKAWILATRLDGGPREAAQAVELAARAVALTRGADASALDTLAAAYAAAGRYAEAVATAAEALAAAERGNPERAAAIRGRLELFRRQQPYRTAEMSD